MEIKRVGDQFIVDIQKKRFFIYWNRKYTWGENLIRRFFERITIEEVEKLHKAITILNQAVLNKKKSLTEGEIVSLDEANKVVRRIVILQCVAYFSTIPVEKLQQFIEACHAFAYEYGTAELKRLYQRRFEGLETPTERKAQECSCLEDWAVTRSFVARFVATDVVAAYRYVMLDDSKKIVADLMTKKSKLSIESFFIQAFMVQPAITDMDKRGIMTETIQECFKTISLIFEKRHIFSKAIGEKGISEYGQYRDKVRALHNYIKEKYTPKRSLIEPRTECCKWSNEYRKQLVEDFFKEWDTNMVDDIAYFKEQQALSEQSEREKKEAIDKSDIEYTGKTQEQWRAEQPGLEMELKDAQTGEVIRTEKI